MGSGQHRGEPEDRYRFEICASQAHRSGCEAAAHGSEARVAPDPLAERLVADRRQTDRCNARSDQRTCQTLQRLRDIHAAPIGREGKQQRRGADAHDTGLHGAALVTQSVDQGTGGHLAYEGRNCAECAREPNCRRGPAFLHQIDGHEYAESSLHGGDEEIDPIERVAAAARGDAYVFWLSRCSLRR